MAPEYVVCGKLTEKADVYSFGLLVIEVVCGRRRNSFSEDSYSILQMVWNNYGTGKLCDEVDSTLDGRFLADQVSRVLQIGLLCTQASAELRPVMSMVVKMLTENYDIPQPTQPPFLSFSSLPKSFTPNETYNPRPIPTLDLLGMTRHTT
ncbi:cysteine-rich receptor-like protein kinase 3 [Papaver somniferum]|uniref:cysteine-rich receptor-like protein kinase 3 n=1 Tax=Papaver somniferum TaxID=3469 RepID=UPI000E6F9602|nr:cysteine-rich receptor-like protein kinase 3 [Papaver somniferum]